MNKKFIIKLIAQDMKHEQLIGSLKKLGFESDLHDLNILDLVARLMGVPPKKITWDWTDIYMHYIGKVMDYEITGTGKNLLPLAEKCYNSLSLHMSLGSTSATSNQPG